MKAVLLLPTGSWGGGKTVWYSKISGILHYRAPPDYKSHVVNLKYEILNGELLNTPVTQL